MNCRNCIIELKKLSETDLISQEFSKHLSNCETCSTIFNKVKSTWHLIEIEKKFASNPFFYTRLSEKLENIENQKRVFSFNTFFTLNNAIRLASFTFLLSIGVFVGIILMSGLSENTNLNLSDSEQKTILDEYASENYLSAIDDQNLATYYFNYQTEE